MAAAPNLLPSLESRPDYASAVGIICSEWANLEWQMFLFYAAVSGSPPALARATFGALESNRARIEIIRASCQTLISVKKKLDEIERLLAKLGKTAARRNRVVHDLWCVAETPHREVMQLRLSKIDGTQCVEGIALGDLQALAQDIRDLARQIEFVCSGLSATVPASIEKLRQQPGIAVVFAAKGQPPGRRPKCFHSQK